MAETKLVATARTEFGKGAARRLRRAHQIPAVLYGHGTAPLHVAQPGHEVMMAVKHTNALFEIEFDGTTTLALAKDVQIEPVRNVIEHLDLLIVRRGEKVTVDVPVHVIGESAPGTIHVVETQTLSLEAEATHLPDRVVVLTFWASNRSYSRPYLRRSRCRSPPAWRLHGEKRTR